MPRTPSNLSQAPKGRKTTAQGNALGNRPTTNPSPEGAERSRQENCEWLGESKVPKEAYGLKIPAHWRWSTFGDLSERVSVGHVGSMKDEYLEAGIPFLRGQNVRANRYDSKGLKYVSAAFHTSLKKSALEPFDIVVTRSGDVGIACVIPEHLGEANCSDLVIIKRPHGIDSHFAAYYLNSAAKRFITAGKVGVAITHFNTKSVADLPVPLPPLPEQRRIVARIEELFSRLDAGVAALRHAKAQLQRYRQSVLAAAVTGQLTQAWREQHPDTESAEKLLKRITEQRRGQGNGKGKYRDALGPDSPPELPQIPANWIWTTLDSLCISKVGNAFKSAQFKDAGVRLLRGENIEPGALRWANTRYWPESQIDEFQDLLVDRGDVIIAMDRPLISSGLKVAVAKKEDIPCLLVQRVTRLRPIDPITSTFIFTNVNTKRFVDQLIGNQTGTQIPHITEKGIRCFAVPLPPLAEQHQIVAEVEARTTAIDHLEAELDRQITRSNRLRQSALASAFAGKL